MDHESLKVYRTKRPMTKRFARFIGEIEYYDPTIVYRPGKLQMVPDALSRMAGRCEGPPVDTDRFQAMDDDTSSMSSKSDDFRPESIPPAPSHPSAFYRKVEAQLTRGGTEEVDGEMEEMDEDFKEECARYKKGRRGALFNVESRRRVVWDREEAKKVMRIVHEDLGHYGKEATAKAAKQRFEVANDRQER
jgi:hypothetical protein